MKKIVLFVLLFIMMPNIKAFTYSDWTTEYYSEIDPMFVEKEVRYKWFLEDIINEQYLKENEGSQEFINYEDFILSDYSDYSTIKPTENENIIVETKEIEISLNSNGIVYVMLKKNKFNSPVYISEIKLIDVRDNSVIDYSFVDSKYNALNNNSKKDYMNVTNNDEIIIKLDKEYNVYDILCELSYYKEGSNTSSFSFQYGVSNEILAYSKTFNYANCSINCGLKISYNQSFKKYDSALMTYYRYATKLYKKYDIKKVYQDGYFKELDGYIKDVDQSMTYYRYITDEKIQLSPDGKIHESCGKNICLQIYNNYDKVVKKEEQEEKIVNDKPEEKNNEERIVNDKPEENNNEEKIVNIPQVKEDIVATDIVKCEKIVNPKTNDEIESILIRMIISTVLILLIIILIIKKLYNNRAKSQYISSFVE